MQVQNLAAPPLPQAAPTWLRLADAAARVGLPLSTFRSVVQSGTYPIRVHRAGARGLVFVAASDVENYRAAMLAGVLR